MNDNSLAFDLDAILQGQTTTYDASDQVGSVVVAQNIGSQHLFHKPKGPNTFLPGIGKPMCFRDFTLLQVQQEFGLTTDATQPLFAAVLPVPLSQTLAHYFDDFRALDMSLPTERGRSGKSVSVHILPSDNENMN